MMIPIPNPAFGRRAVPAVGRALMVGLLILVPSSVTANFVTDAVVDVLDDEVPTVRAVFVDEGNWPHFEWAPEQISLPDDLVLFYAPGGHHVQTHAPQHDGAENPPPDGCIDFPLTQMSLVAFYLGDVPGAPGNALVQGAGLALVEIPIAPVGQCAWRDDGTLHYHCDNHPVEMRGRLERV